MDTTRTIEELQAEQQLLATRLACLRAIKEMRTHIAELERELELG